MSQLRPWPWMALHGLITLLLTLLISVLLGCSNSLPSGGEPAFGPEFPESKLTEVQNLALSFVDPSEIRAGQAVLLESNLRIYNGPVQPIETTIIEVMGTRETPEALTVTLAVAIDSHVDDSLDKPGFEKSVVFEKTRPSSESTLSVSPFLFKEASKTNNDDSKQKDEDTVERISYHDLQVTKGYVDLPPAVRISPDCGGVTNCQLFAFTIRYNYVVYLKSGAKLYRVARYVIAPKAPYFAVLLERCNSGFVDINGYNYYVDQCEFATDFRAKK